MNYDSLYTHFYITITVHIRALIMNFFSNSQYNLANILLCPRHKNISAEQRDTEWYHYNPPRQKESVLACPN